MTNRICLFRSAFLLAAMSSGVAVADLKQVADGVFEDDFNDGRMDHWVVDEKQQATRPPLILGIARQDGGGALHLKGDFQNRVFLDKKQFRDFSLAVRVRKTAGSYAGVVVRDHWRVYFQMRSFLSLNSDAKDLQSQGELFKSSITNTTTRNRMRSNG